MAKRSDLFWGLVIGLVGNLLVSTAFALVEHPEWSPYLNPVYILSWIAFVVFCSVLLFRKDRCEKAEPKKHETRKEGDEKEPDIKSLIAEYQVLNKVVNRRGSDTLLVDSIMIPSSLIVVLFAIEFKESLGISILFNVPNAGFVPLLSLMLIMIPYILWWTSTKLDKICFDRMCAIEKELHIKGHQYIRERTRCKIWLKVRRNMWHVFFLLFIGTYIFTAWWLFRETIVV